MKCRKDTENIDPNMVRIKNNSFILQLKCSVSRIKKLRFLKKQEAKGLSSNLGIKTPLSKIPLLGEIVNTFLLVGDKFVPEVHLKQPGFTYIACGPFTKNKEKTGKFIHARNTDFIYKNEPGRLVFNMIWLIANQKI